MSDKCSYGGYPLDLTPKEVIASYRAKIRANKAALKEAIQRQKDYYDEGYRYPDDETDD